MEVLAIVFFWPFLASFSSAVVEEVLLFFVIKHFLVLFLCLK